MTHAARPFTVFALAPEGGCTTHCKTLQGALRSAKGFDPGFTSIVIRHNNETVKVIR